MGEDPEPGRQGGDRDMNQFQVDDGGFLTPREVASYLRIGRTLTYQLLRAGEIPSVRVGRRIRVRTRDLIRWGGR